MRVQTVKDVFGGEVRGLHSTYNNQIKEQVPILLPMLQESAYSCAA